MKLLIIENTIINFGTDRGGEAASSSDMVDVTKETAGKLVAAGRALYTDKSDDPSKGALNTATPSMLKAAAEVRSLRAAAEKSAATKAPEGQGAGDSQPPQ